MLCLVESVRTAREAGSMKLHVERPSVCLSVCPIIQPPHDAAEGLLLWARRPSYRLIAAEQCSAENASSVTLSSDVGS